ncbi:biosynthetic-type acetolactate synthase large subunit [Candidatus Woesearchaeota archaeon]|nr:biosynthetic-type acetolactate synthase large subunit [Candidatus Woesearchaeota archaeon]
MKGTEAIIETMLKSGTDTTFGYPGGSVIPLFDEYLEYEGKIRNILVRHEQAAAHAADAYARVTGKPGVCIATSGPGSTNLVTGIMTAYMDSSPLIAFGGQVAVDLLGNDAFQEADMLGITMPITKHSFQIRNADEISETILKAYKIATGGRPGPVYIDLPKDPQIQETHKSIPKDVHIESYQPKTHPHTHQINKAAQMIMNAQRPIIVAGGGVVLANSAEELTSLAHFLKAPVTTTLMGKGSIDESDPLSLGMLGMHGRKIANYAVLNCDLMIAIGCRFSDRITGNLESFADNCKVIHIDIDPAEIGKNVSVDLPIVGDAKLSLLALLKALTENIAKDTSWYERIRELQKECNCDYNEKAKINPRKVLDEVLKVKKENDIIATGVGQHQMFSAHFLKINKPRTFISSGGAGTMGFGLPASIGAKTARPNVNVFDIDGDGSFQMNSQELATCAEENIKVNPIIISNHYLGMVRQWLEIYFGKRYSQVSLGKNPDFVKLAQAYGLDGTSVTKPDELKDALQNQQKSKDTYIINVEVEQESNILPMLPPGGHIKEAFGGCMVAPGCFFNKR